jgi:hypothetical protein
MQANLFIISLLWVHTGICQRLTGIEELNYTRNRLSSTVVPRIYFQDSLGWYGEARYNYESSETFSLYGGKTFSKHGAFSLSLTPFGGLVYGRLNGASLGSNLAMNYKRWSYSSVSQYTISWEDQKSNFLFSWSELGYQVSGKVYAGLAMQQTRSSGVVGVWDPGLEICFLINKWNFPVYLFDPMSHERIFVLGVTRIWQQQGHQPRKL